MMQYLEKVLKVKIDEQKCGINDKLPFAYRTWYDFRCAKLLGIKVLFVYLKEYAEDVRLTINHMKYLAEFTGMQIVFVCKNLTVRQRDVLIEHCIAFVVEDRQVYLPFVGILLREYGNVTVGRQQEFLPATQLFLLSYIYGRKRKVYLRDMIQKLNVSNMTGSRSLKQLESVGLLRSVKYGVSKVVEGTLMGKELFDKALPYLLNPVRKIVYIDSGQTDGLCLSGESALSMNTMLEHPNVVCYAGYGEGNFSDYVYENERNLYQVKLELWKYNPKLLSDSGIVDVLSLYLSMKDSQDERVQSSLEEMMEKFWGWYNGTRVKIF